MTFLMSMANQAISLKFYLSMGAIICLVIDAMVQSNELYKINEPLITVQNVRDR